MGSLSCIATNLVGAFVTGKDQILHGIVALPDCASPLSTIPDQSQSAANVPISACIWTSAKVPCLTCCLPVKNCSKQVCGPWHDILPLLCQGACQGFQSRTLAAGLKGYCYDLLHLINWRLPSRSHGPESDRTTVGLSYYFQSAASIGIAAAVLFTG